MTLHDAITAHEAASERLDRAAYNEKAAELAWNAAHDHYASLPESERIQADRDYINTRVEVREAIAAVRVAYAEVRAQRSRLHVVREETGT